MPANANTPRHIARMIRVNHAGEFGAQRIYAGQLAVLGNSAIAPELEHMAAQEQAHLDYFARELVQRRVRPTALHPLWHVLGFALGAGTALLGEKAAMACTVAVEEVIDEHYQQQLAKIGNSDPELAAKIEQFRQEELEHRDIGLAHDAEQAPAYKLLSGAIKGASRLAIKLSERI